METSGYHKGRKRKWLGHWLQWNNLMVKALEDMLAGGNKGGRRRSKIRISRRRTATMEGRASRRIEKDGHPTCEDLPI